MLNCQKKNRSEAAEYKEWLDQIYDKHRKTITDYLKHYNTIKQQLQDKREDVLESANYELEATGIHGTTLSDTTAKRALKLIDVKNQDDVWIKCIDTVIDTCTNEYVIKSVMEKFDIRYFKSRGVEASYIDTMGERTYDRYQKEVIKLIARGYENYWRKNGENTAQN